MSNVWSTLSLCYGRCICTRLNIFPHHLSSPLLLLLLSLFSISAILWMCVFPLLLPFCHLIQFYTFCVFGFRKWMLLLMPFCSLLVLLVDDYILLSSFYQQAKAVSFTSSNLFVCLLLLLECFNLLLFMFFIRIHMHKIGHEFFDKNFGVNWLWIKVVMLKLWCWCWYGRWNSMEFSTFYFIWRFFLSKNFL